MATAKATVRFHAVREGRTYEVGEAFEGSDVRVRQLVERGYVKPDQKPAQRRRAAKPKE